MKSLTMQQLVSAGHSAKGSFELDLGNGQLLQIEQVLRILPDKRVVAKTIKNDKTMLTKIFFHARNFQQEIKSYQQLEKTGVKTPLLLFQQALAEGGICDYHFIDDAVSFGDGWQTADQAIKKQMLEKLLAILRQLYENGLLQADIHLDNFIFSQQALYALDPAGCKKLAGLGEKINNLALLLAQFPFVDWPLVSEAIAKSFGDIKLTKLKQQALLQHKKRRHDFLQKIYRECTYIHSWSIGKQQGQHLLIRCVREFCSQEMQNLLEHIEKIPGPADILKQGNSSVVSSCVVGDKKMVVKNSRNKNIWRLLRRCLRRSRASNSWYFSHLLAKAGINTPTPIALVERKLGPFVLESWFVSSHIEGDNLLDVWLYEKPSPQEWAAIAGIFAAMNMLNVSHGDMKASNLLVKDHKIWLIDYDGMQQHCNKAAALTALGKDQKRFMQNWPHLKIEEFL